MNEKTRKEGREFAKFLESLPEEVRVATNSRVQEDSEAEHNEFREAFAAKMCYVCGDALDSFNKDRPCLHWLLKPAAFTKRDFPSVTARYGIFQIQSYLRWVANEEAFATNINDLAGEGTGKRIELTIKWRDCDWAFSMGEGDYQGHEGGADGSDQPHYHFQMRYKKQAFIRYNDFHIQLRDADVHSIEAMRALPGVATPMWFGGEGMSDVLNEETVEHIAETSTPTDDPERGAFNLNTMIFAKDGEQLRGEDLLALFDEAREKGVTVASLASKIKNAHVQTLIGPGDGVVEQAPRSGGRKRRR